MDGAGKSYQVSPARRIAIGAGTFFFMLIVAILLVMLTGKRGPGLGAILIFAVVFYIMSFPVIRVYQDRLTAKIAVGKVKEMPFDGGKFTLTPLTGFGAWIQTFSADTYQLKYHPAGGGKARVIAPMLPKAQLKEIYDSLPDSAKSAL